MKTIAQVFSTYFSDGSYRLRSLETSDIDKLVPMINEAYSYQDVAKGSPRTSVEHLTKRAAEVDFYVLTYKNTLIGCLYLEPRATILHFGLLTLHPGYRGKGIGNLLIKTILDYAYDNKLQSVALDYMSLAPWLKQYYERYGFVETGKVTNWGKIDLIEMQNKISAQ